MEVGSWVTPGQPVVRVVDLARMKAEFGIPQQRTPEVAAGMPAELTIDLYPGTTFDAEVLRVGVVADPASGQFLLDSESRLQEFIRKLMATSREEDS